MSAALTEPLPSVRSRFSSRIFSENGSRATSKRACSASRRKISNRRAPELELGACIEAVGGHRGSCGRGRRHHDYRAARAVRPPAVGSAWPRRTRTVSSLEALGILAAGGAAGAINVVVGSGTLITFPVLLAFGYAPVVANVSNTIGLVPGSVAGAVGYRARAARPGRAAQRGSRARPRSGPAAGAVLLLTLPPSAFKSIVPVFIVPRAGPDRRAAAPEPRLRAAAPAHAERPGRARALVAPSSPRASTAATSAPPRASCCSRSSASPSTSAAARSTRRRTCSRAWPT